MIMYRYAINLYMMKKRKRQLESDVKKINNIIDIIRIKGLDKVHRKRELVYQRCYLMAKLRALGCTYQYIGDLFNKDHAAVIHCINNHKLFTKQSDIIYRVIISDVAEMYQNMNNNIQPDIFEDVMSCEDVAELFTIKKKIEKGIYF
jgi:hypothetical protein